MWICFRKGSLRQSNQLDSLKEEDSVVDGTKGGNGISNPSDSKKLLEEEEDISGLEIQKVQDPLPSVRSKEVQIVRDCEG